MSFTASLPQVCLQNVQHSRERNSVWRLQTVHIISPPWTGRPPKRTLPHVGVLSQIIQHSLHGSFALVVVSTRELTDDTDLLVVLEPLSSAGDTLLANGTRHAGLGSTRPIRVQILVHLIDDLVLGILQVLHVVVHIGPGPGPGVRVTFNEDILLRGASLSDPVNGGLVEVQDQLLVHVMVFIVCELALGSRIPNSM